MHVQAMHARMGQAGCIYLQAPSEQGASHVMMHLPRRPVFTNNYKYTTPRGSTAYHDDAAEEV